MSALLAALVLCLCRPAAAEDPVRKSLVKFFTVIQKPNYFQPWQLAYQENSGGSGSIIEGGRILTNAHVVADSAFVQVQKSGDTRKYTAKVEFVGHDTELAVLKVDDPEFFKGTVPVKFGELPQQRDKLVVYGFPIGGDELSTTEGIVSRVEVLTYTHSQRDLLAIQTDAAINPGNSGGPVFKDGKQVGVAFQSYSGSGAENIGYAVPVTLVKRFLKDIRDGAYHGVPDLGVYRQNMEGESLRGRCGLNAADPGVLVTKVVYGSSSWGLLREGDILAGLDGVPIERDGTVSLDGRIRVNFSHLVSMHEMGDVVKAAVVREGRRLTVAIPLKKSAGLVSGPEHDVHPTYFIFAGLVFIPLGYDYMSQWPWKDVEPRFRHYYSDVLPTQSRKQVVLISQVLAHDVNVGYHKWGNVVVEKINGRPITEMRDVIAAFEHPLGRHHVIEVDNHAGGGQGALDYYSNFGTQIVIDAEAAKRSGAEILARYSVPADRSPDLKP